MMYNKIFMNQEYTRRLEKIEAVLAFHLPESPGSSWSASTFAGLKRTVSPDLLKALTGPGWDLVNRGGKRWRPLLMTLVCESLGGGGGALSLTPLVEFPHNASLIHDDIEDNSDERRGKPAVHVLFGSDTAINGGCFMYFLALSCLDAWKVPFGDLSEKIPAAGLSGEAAYQAVDSWRGFNTPPLCGGLVDFKNRIYALWGEYMRRLHLGQAMDIAWHRDFSSLPDLEEYETMCRLKTGCLAGLAAALGVYTAAAVLAKPWTEAEAPAEIFSAAAEKLGVGFQILDDVKNLTTGVPGKKRGDDVVEGKKSLPVLLYLHRRRDRREFAARCFAAARAGGTGAAEVEEFIAELETAGVLEEAGQRGLALINEARSVFCGASFTGFPVNQEARNLLAGIVDLIS
jgi:octaprenyl-diphosphate synthase